uniref:Uncharacterized protein n=1 Tax=Rhodoplanes serenus TaxID=200615 RepID=A0AAJ5T9R6_9BRAD|nr:hypothetical protein RHODPL_RHODPL_00061 [Rhodoplanes serenus]
MGGRLRELFEGDVQPSASSTTNPCVPILRSNRIPLAHLLRSVRLNANVVREIGQPVGVDEVTKAAHIEWVP